MNFIKRCSEMIFNHLNIRMLLRGWAISSVLGVIIFSVVMIVSNQFITNEQEKLIQRSLPLENISRLLSSSITRLIERHSQLMFVDNLTDFNNIINQTSLTREFEQYFNKLRTLLVSTDQKLIKDLQRSHENYLREDKLLNDSILGGLKKTISLNFRINHFEQLLDDLRSSLEALSGIINLQSSHSNREIRIATSDHNVQSFFSSLQGSLYLKENRALKSAFYLRQSLDRINYLTHTFVTEQNKDILVSLKGNDIGQETMLIKNSISEIRGHLKGYPVLIEKVRNIDIKIDGLLEDLMVGDSSIYQLKDELIAHNSFHKNQSHNVRNSIDALVGKLDQLYLMTELMTTSSVADTRRVSNLSLGLVVFLSIFFIINILIGVYILNLRIKKPLDALRNAMSLQKQGKLKTKLDTNNVPNDEFAELAHDYNNFVDANAILLDRLYKAQIDILESKSTTEAILENALVGIVHLINRRFISVNQKFEDMIGFTRSELLGHTTEFVYADRKTFDIIGKDVYAKLNAGISFQGEYYLRRKDGETICCVITAKNIDNNALERGSIWLYEDVTIRKQTENKLRYLANFDMLTELPNRSSFTVQLNQELRKSQRQQKSLAVLFIDLDRFKQVNDTLGHDIGDELLKEVAIRLKSCIRGADSVARLGGDEFTIMLSEVSGVSGVKTVASNILKALNKPVSIAQHRLSVSPSIGISLSPKDGDDVSTLLRNADAAMYHAKKMGRNNYQLYETSMNTASEKRFDMEIKLRQALENDEFVLYYQPQVLTHTREVIGYEALVRWQSKELGLVSPAEFVPILEDTGLIVPVGEWIIRTACQQLKNWHDQGHIIKMSINLSALQFYQRDLIDMIAKIIQEYRIDPEYLDFEITESVLMEGTDHSEKMLNQLSELGVQLALDDFGTGYSSLAYLKRFPIDIIKIDQSFIRDVLVDKSDAAICEAIIDIARRMNKELIAEGVETEEQFDYLLERNCKIIQGYLFGRPLPADKIIWQKEANLVD